MVIKEFTVHYSKFLFRFWRLSVYVVVFLLTANAALAAEKTPSIAVFDWTIAETLLSLDPGFVSLGNVAAFHTWTGDDYGNANIIDIGTQTFPNMELLSSIGPDRILLSPSQVRLSQRLADLAPVTIIQSYPYVRNKSDSLWARFDAFTLEIGISVDRKSEAEQLTADTKAHIETLGDKIVAQPPLLIIQLVNEHYVRVYGDNSIFQGVLQQLGLTNAWTGRTDQWGRSLVSIRELFNINLEEARLVIMESAFPVGIEEKIETSGMWRYIPSVQRRDFIVLPPSFWIAGAQPSAQRFANALVRALK
jgi:ABC-type Fe3+-hydroxamate transport system substrate-binding protein